LQEGHGAPAARGRSSQFDPERGQLVQGRQARRGRRGGTPLIRDSLEGLKRRAIDSMRRQLVQRGQAWPGRGGTPLIADSPEGLKAATGLLALIPFGSVLHALGVDKETAKAMYEGGHTISEVSDSDDTAKAAATAGSSN
jgi:hypothetical protein